MTPFAQPEAAPLPAMTRLRPERGLRTLRRGFATGEWVVHLVEDGGEVRYDEIGVVTGDAVEVVYRIRDDDPLSARAEWTWRSVNQGPGWDVAVESRMTITATAAAFHVATDLAAYEDGRRFFSRTWDDRVPRDGL